jgi:hypothetical protein
MKGALMPKKTLRKQTASFIETMDCLPVLKLPEGPEWTYEIKLDGYRLEVVAKRPGNYALFSPAKCVESEVPLHCDRVRGSSGSDSPRRRACSAPSAPDGPGVAGNSVAA